MVGLNALLTCESVTCESLALLNIRVMYTLFTSLVYRNTGVRCILHGQDFVMNTAMYLWFQDILEDETKFNLADLNKDKALDLEEYIAFHNPEMEDYKHMHQFLVDDDMKDYDKNKDGKLSLEEFHYYEAGNLKQAL